MHLVVLALNNFPPATDVVACYKRSFRSIHRIWKKLELGQSLRGCTRGRSHVLKNKKIAISDGLKASKIFKLLCLRKKRCCARLRKSLVETACPLGE